MILLAIGIYISWVMFWNYLGGKLVDKNLLQPENCFLLSIFMGFAFPCILIGLLSL